MHKSNRRTSKKQIKLLSKNPRPIKGGDFAYITYYPKNRSVYSPSTRNSKCRQGVDVFPESPDFAIKSPACTICPLVTNSSSQCAYTVCMPPPWSMSSEKSTPVCPSYPSNGVDISARGRVTAARRRGFVLFEGLHHINRERLHHLVQAPVHRRL